MTDSDLNVLVAVIGCMLAAAWVVGEQVAAASGWKPAAAGAGGEGG